MAFLLLGSIGLAIAYSGRERIEERLVPLAPAGTPVPAVAAVTDEEEAFYKFVGARLRAITAESTVLAQLGEERSRNVVELQVRSDRVLELCDQIDDYLAANPVPTRFETAVATYRSGSVTLRTGIDDAKSSILRFDWDGVAAALDRFEEGTNQLQTSYELMRDSVSGGTPTAAATATG
jgi:hypothetical protein